MNTAEINDDVPNNTYVIGLQVMEALLKTTFVTGIREENMK